MKNSILQGKWKQARGEWKKMRRDWKKEWDKLTHRDVRRIDNELDKIVGLFQERYGDSWEKSASLVERYFSAYRDRTQAAINARTKRSARRRGWVWGIVGLTLFAALPFVWRQRQGKHGAKQTGMGKTATSDWQATSGQKAPPS